MLHGRPKNRMKMRQDPSRSDTGFTMIELLVAIVLLMFGVVAMAELVPRAMQSNFASRNNTTALVEAQRLLEQMAQQPLNSLAFACPTTNPPAGHYAFCDRDSDGIALGDVNAGTGVTVVGCPLDAAGQVLDFQVAVAACNGYSVTKQVLWNINTGETQAVQLRWRVITWHVGGRPVRKVFIVGARSGIATTGTPGQQGYSIRDLKTVVGR